MEQDSSDNNGPAASSSSSFHNILSPSARNSQAFHPISNSNFSSPPLQNNSRRDSQNNQQHGVSNHFCFIYFENLFLLLTFLNSSRQCCGNWIFIPDPKFFHPGSSVIKVPDPQRRIKAFLTQIIVTKLLRMFIADPESRIRIFQPRIPGSKKHRIPVPDPQH